MQKNKAKRHQQQRQKRAVKARDRRNSSQKSKQSNPKFNTLRTSCADPKIMTGRIYESPFGPILTYENPNIFSKETFGGIDVVCPRISTEVQVRTEAEAHLRKQYTPGEHSDSGQISEILKYHNSFYHEKLLAIIPRLGSRHLMDFLLYQYDQSCRIEELGKSGQLSNNEHAQWQLRGPIFRRALKYLAELVTIEQPPEAPSVSAEEGLDLIDVMIVCAELSAILAISRDQTFMLFPGDTTLIISPPGDVSLCRLELRKEIREQMSDLGRRNLNDLKKRAKYMSHTDLLCDFQINILKQGFADVFGIPYQETLGLIMHLITSVVMPNNGRKGFCVPFVQREKVISALSGEAKITPEAASRLLDGFTITHHNLMAEGRVIWKPKQEHRAYHRGFFALPHETGMHLTWSEEMAKECALLLMRDFVFQHIPPEWEHPSIRSAVSKLSNVCGANFERVCQSLLKDRGLITARNYKNSIGQGRFKIAIPPDVGELDCLIYCNDTESLLLFEFKLVLPGTEPSTLRDDRTQFIKPKGFFEKFRKKLNWVRNNHAAICLALNRNPSSASAPSARYVNAAIITYYPSIASYFSDDIPCISVTEFFDAWDKLGRTGWPLEKGVYSL